MKPNHERFGYSQEEWEAFKAEAREILIGIASKRAMITYGQLANRMTTIAVEPHVVVLWEIIGDVSRDEEHAGRGMLSVLVVHQDANRDPGPGPGFFKLAEYFERDTSDHTKCWIAEMNKIHAIWSKS